jgi:hypothetical protein
VSLSNVTSTNPINNAGNIPEGILVLIHR